MSASTASRAKMLEWTSEKNAYRINRADLPGNCKSGRLLQRILHGGMWLHAQFGQEPADAPLDLVADRADLLDRLAGRVVELPVEVTLARIHRTCVAATHHDDDIGSPHDLVRPGLRKLGTYIDALLGHCRHDRLVHAGCRLRTSREDVDLVPCELAHEARRDLGAARVVNAQEKD